MDDQRLLSQDVIEDALRDAGSDPIVEARLRLFYGIGAGSAGIADRSLDGIRSTKTAAFKQKIERRQPFHEETSLEKAQDPDQDEYRLSVDVSIDDSVSDNVDSEFQSDGGQR